jgi:hypothetical protein
MLAEERHDLRYCGLPWSRRPAHRKWRWPCCRAAAAAASIERSPIGGCGFSGSTRVGSSGQWHEPRTSSTGRLPAAGGGAAPASCARRPCVTSDVVSWKPRAIVVLEAGTWNGARLEPTVAQQFRSVNVSGRRTNRHRLDACSNGSRPDRAMPAPASWGLWV